MTRGLADRWLKRLTLERNCLFAFNLKGIDIYKQLLFEEFLYRKACEESKTNGYLVVNGDFRGPPAIVMGVSGKAANFVKDMEECKRRQITLYNRFTGGGTVVIDENSVVSSIICPKTLASHVNPATICKWGFETFYKPSGLFNSHFNLVDGDFVLEHSDSIRKIAGNAQAYNDKALVHHTVFLWQMSPLISQLLTTPTKAPAYRNNRCHDDFLNSTKDALCKPLGTTFEYAWQLCQAMGNGTSFFKHRIIVNVCMTAKDSMDPDEAIYSKNIITTSADFIDEATSTLNSPGTKISK